MSKRSSSKKSKQSLTKSKGKKTGIKKKLSGYVIFCNEQRTHRKAEFETLKPKEVMQRLGAGWRKLSAQQQETYKAKAPAKPHDDVSNKSESTSQRSQSQKRTATIKHAAKTKPNKKHQSRSKGRGKSTHRHEDSHQETGINPSE